jgi:hypothetical protein
MIESGDLCAGRTTRPPHTHTVVLGSDPPRRRPGREEATVELLVRLLLGLLLVAHGLVHLMWFAPNDDPTWPFRLDRSWLLSEAARRPVAIVLVALTVAGFALLGLAVCGVPGLASIWPGLAIGSAVASLIALVLFWDRQLVWGMAIDVALIVVALWRPAWTDGLG